MTDRSNWYMEAISASLWREPIQASRLAVLDQLAEAILDTRLSERPVQLVFICTHNSRRSQFAQVLAKAAALHFSISMDAFSGGTEVTACHPNTLTALRNAGFMIEPLTPDRTDNPVFRVVFGDGAHTLELYSKHFNAPENPQGAFIAVMTCSEADRGCPFVPGADKRVSLPYRDPKLFDDTAEALHHYDSTCLEIGREMFHVFRKVHDHED